jgi:hypothetical protein
VCVIFIWVLLWNAEKDAASQHFKKNKVLGLDSGLAGESLKKAGKRDAVRYSEHRKRRLINKIV